MCDCDPVLAPGAEFWQSIPGSRDIVSCDLKRVEAIEGLPVKAFPVDPRTADLCIIGHDPRLQESDTEAEYVFFMNYLEREQPKGGPELNKYNLARAAIDYIAYLTNNEYNTGKRLLSDTKSLPK